MTFKPAVWSPIAAVLAAVNVGAVWFAAQAGEAWHATIHAGLGLAFGLWAQHLRHRAERKVLPAADDALELEVDALREELADVQERVDFAERMLAQGRKARPEDQDR